MSQEISGPFQKEKLSWAVELLLCPLILVWIQLGSVFAAI